jgi:hypothetical protein
MSPAVRVSPSGKLVASSDVVERLRSLCEADAAMLASGGGTDGRRARPSANRRPLIHLGAETGNFEPIQPEPRQSLARPESANAATDDEDIEATLVRLMGEVRREALRSFQLAREHTVAGGLVELRDIHIGQATRLTRAFADLVEAQARPRGKPARVVVEHYHRHFHQRAS